jgi:hypothetical protein
MHLSGWYCCICTRHTFLMIGSHASVGDGLYDCVGLLQRPVRAKFCSSGPSKSSTAESVTKPS